MLTNYLARTEHALSIDEKDPEQIKKRLKIIRGLSYPPIIMLEDIEALHPELCVQLAKAYNDFAQYKVEEDTPSPSDFFLTTVTKSPYTMDIELEENGYVLGSKRYDSSQSLSSSNGLGS